MLYIFPLKCSPSPGVDVWDGDKGHSEPVPFMSFYDNWNFHITDKPSGSSSLSPHVTGRCCLSRHTKTRIIKCVCVSLLWAKYHNHTSANYVKNIRTFFNILN